MRVRSLLGLWVPFVCLSVVACVSGDGAQAPPDYERLFPDDRIVDVDLAITDADWATLLATPLVDVDVPATLTYDGIVVPQVAVRFKGNSSRRSVLQMGSQRYSFKVDIDYTVAGQNLLGIDKLNFNNGFKDPSYLRERLATETYRALGVPMSRSAFIRLSKNGAPFGLYLAVEQVDKDFLRAHFPDDSGNLYKPDIPDGELVWRGADISFYPNLELKTNTSAPDHTALLAFLDVLNHAADADLETQLGAVFDVETFLRYLAVTTALVNQDSYNGMGHNYYLYQDTTSGRFVLIAWDTNEAFGNFSCGLTADALLGLSYAQPICGDPLRRPLVTRVLSVPVWRARYEELLRELLAGAFDPALVANDVDSLADLVRADVAADPTRFYPLADFETNLTQDLVSGTQTTFGLTSFAERRQAALMGQLP